MLKIVGLAFIALFSFNVFSGESANVEVKMLSASSTPEDIVNSFFLPNKVVETKYRGIVFKESETATQNSVLKETEKCPAQKRGIAISIQFELNSYNIQPDAHKTIEKIAAAMNQDKLVHCNFIIEGHTDVSGDAWFNMKLSKNRAESVKNFLVFHDVNSDRLKIAGKGETDNFDTNNPYSEANRRVQFMVNP